MTPWPPQQDAYSKQCALAKLGLCASGKSKNTCPALTLGPDLLTPDQINSTLKAGSWYCYEGGKDKREQQLQKHGNTTAAVCTCATSGYDSDDCAAGVKDYCGKGRADVGSWMFCRSMRDMEWLRSSVDASRAVASFLGHTCFTESDISSASTCSCFQVSLVFEMEG